MHKKDIKFIAVTITIAILFMIFTTGSSMNFGERVTLNGYSGGMNQYFVEDDLIGACTYKYRYNSSTCRLFSAKNSVEPHSINRYISQSICSITSTYKLKYFSIIDQIFKIYNDSVFVVSYVHKSDGKIKNMHTAII